MKIGIIAGNFDCIHPGYIKMFDEMVGYCDYVTVMLQTDPTIERPEKCRPILSVEDRIDIVSSLNQVDDIFTYTLESELYRFLKIFEENHLDENDEAEYIRFLGDDYINKSFTGDDLAIPVQYLNRDHGWSTTKYKQLIADSICGTNLINGLK
jgi:glycerol-3-phosphate cytidylyltransferase